MNQFNQTIISLITPPLMGAIAVIRLSGDDCLEITEKFFSRKIDKPRYAYFGEIRNGKETIDQVVLVYYKGPNSFTGEDVVEISCHGSMLIAQEIISLFVSEGVRLAERGEFSSRAFYHGKIDLVQAEAINSLINAVTPEQKKLSLFSLEGETSKLLSPLLEKMGGLLANIEVNIDYPEYLDIEEVTKERIDVECEEMIKVLNELLDKSDKSQYVMNGINVALVGSPNVGKSSLLNALLNQDKAIVSSIPGTTRDYVEGNISLNGLPLHLIDTAGIREANDPLEKMGIDRSLKTFDEADLILFLLDASSEMSQEEKKLLSLIKEKNKKYLLVYNKKDLIKTYDENKLYISALNKDINKLKEAILKEFDLNLNALSPTLFSSRERGLLNKARDNLVKARDDNKYLSLDLVSVSLKEAYDTLKEILGQSVNVDLEKEIFSHFCVGK